MGIIADQFRLLIEAMEETDRRSQQLTEDCLIRCNALLHDLDSLGELELED